MSQLHNRSQQGSALVVSMIFLLVLTLAGITAMRFASLEEAMAGNAQASGYVFQQVQSEIQHEINVLGKVSGRNFLSELDYKSKMGTVKEADKRFLPDTASDQIKIEGGRTVGGGESFVKTIEKEKKYIRFVRHGAGACPPGTSFNNFTCIGFELDVTGDLGNGARSRQVQGFTFIN